MIQKFRGMLLIIILLLLFCKLMSKLENYPGCLKVWASPKVWAFDRTITHLTRYYTNPEITGVMKGTTLLGSVSVVFLIAIGTISVFLILRRQLLEPLFLTVAATGSWLLSELLKWSFHRPRPTVNQLLHVTGYSFPSAHSMVSMAFYGAMAYLLWMYLPSPRWRWFLTVSLILLIVFIGVSRIYLGVHYPSDVLAGFIAGGIWLTCCVLAFNAASYRTRLARNNLVK
ncbi:MAG: phosphatase PAP2 family protein [Peptococcaceae bacterium]